MRSIDSISSSVADTRVRDWKRWDCKIYAMNFLLFYFLRQSPLGMILWPVAILKWVLAVGEEKGIEAV